MSETEQVKACVLVEDLPLVLAPTWYTQLSVTLVLGEPVSSDLHSPDTRHVDGEVHRYRQNTQVHF